MRNFCFVLLFVISLSACAYSQTIFAPMGAEWYHNQGYGVFHDQVTGNATIQGQACRRITQKAITADFYYQSGFHVYNQADLYVYDNTDTVFVYNNIFHRFTPLYVFNVQAGDTLRLPVFDPTGPYFLNDNDPLGWNYFNRDTDSVTTFIVDSIKTVLYDTSHLKTVFTRNISPSRGIAFSFSQSSKSGAYAEKIGSVGTGFLPQCFSCWQYFDDGAQCSGAIRCYSDSTTIVHLTTGECDEGIKHTTVNSTSLEAAAFFVYPNPASSYVLINGKNVRQVAISDMQGRELLKQEFNAPGQQQYRVDLLGITNGLYLLSIQGDDNYVRSLKLSVTSQY
ncbi:T9SS type A sorting domain-containing protein [Chitinophaga eiseniae]|uniref:T9SS type A sorting domain-containing protein n=1 Tax=Chitinophaga eiseniae TaxID=634771 RepID=A0A847SSY1_9BACT|nr:T9SS type A sorting domain-containing protein [Chitinophaga eiseniae]NLR82247.1 T9SS type A sorting domain-containing protein [Chitinophaga eiseniae]